MSRRINFGTMPLAYPPAIAWVRANGVDPSSVVRNQEVFVDEHGITFQRFVLLKENGPKQLGPDHEPIIQKITVPLISAPENHGL